MVDAVVAGHLCLDLIPDLSGSEKDQFEAVFQPGQLVDIGPVDYCTGGPVSNTGLALTKLGIHTRLMGKVGDDLFGQDLRRGPGRCHGGGPGCLQLVHHRDHAAGRGPFLSPLSRCQRYIRRP